MTRRLSEIEWIAVEARAKADAYLRAPAEAGPNAIVDAFAMIAALADEVQKSTGVSGAMMGDAK